MVKLEEKLIEIESGKERDQEVLENLIIKRGNLMAGQMLSGKKEAKIDSLTEEIQQLKIKVNEITPATIKALELKIAQNEADKIVARKETLKAKQLEIEKELGEDSLKLIKALKRIIPLNKKVNEDWERFNKIAKSTGQKKPSGKYKISSGSQQMCDFVSTILINEWNGKKIQRQSYYNRIKI